MIAAVEEVELARRRSRRFSSHRASKSSSTAITDNAAKPAELMITYSRTSDRMMMMVIIEVIVVVVQCKKHLMTKHREKVCTSVYVYVHICFKSINFLTLTLPTSLLQNPKCKIQKLLQILNFLSSIDDAIYILTCLIDYNRAVSAAVAVIPFLSLSLTTCKRYVTHRVSHVSSISHHLKLPLYYKFIKYITVLVMHHHRMVGIFQHPTKIVCGVLPLKRGPFLLSPPPTPNTRGEQHLTLSLR